MAEDIAQWLDSLGLGQYAQAFANNGLFGHVAGTSALPPIADLRAPMSAFALITSALPPGADFPGGIAEGPFLTQTGSPHRTGFQNSLRRAKRQRNCRP